MDRIEGRARAGDTVLVCASNGRPLARAALSPSSQIRARVWTFEPDETIDNAFFKRRVAASLARRSIIEGAGPQSGLRLIHGESDSLPGVIADRYGDLVVIQLNSAGADKWRSAIVDALLKASDCPRIYERSDSEVRALEGLPPVAPHQFPALLEPMLEGPVVRLRRVEAEHPRVAILGALEARLQHADLIVLAGLNEGTWPAVAEPGPWLSRPMREEMGLPSPERRIGQAAHDVAQLLCAGGEVLLTRSRRAEGAPTVPSRWLSRLDAFLHGQFGSEAAALIRPPEDFAATGPVPAAPGAPMSAEPPPPRPPLAARPRRLSVTEIATWIADPYALYARRVLGIEPLEPIDDEADAGDFGDIVHGGIADVLRVPGLAWPEPAEAARMLEDAFRRRLDRSAARPAQAALWRPRRQRIAGFVAATEAQRRANAPLRAVFAEVKTEHAIGGLPGGPFLLVAKAGRIEHRDGSLSVLDYKTGAVPKEAQVKSGTQPQLTLEAALAARGAFEGIPPLPPGELAYWHLSGGFVPGKVEQRCEGEEAAVTEAAWAGLLRRLHAFDDPAAPYMARPHPRLELFRSPYAVLARVDEWSAGLDRE